MATRHAVASGNWSSTSTWNGGTLPASGDDVHANTFTVTIDQTITAKSLRTTSGSGITAGGRFEVASGSPVITVTDGILAATHNGVNSTYIMKISGGSPSIVANVAAGGATNRYAIWQSAGTPTITGNVTGGSATSVFAVVIDLGTMTVVGNLVGATAPAVLLELHGGAIIVQGNVTAGSAGDGYGIHNIANTTVTVTGNVTGGSASLVYGVYNTAASAIFDITGTVTGGSNATGYGIFNTGSTAQVTVTGAVVGGSTTTAYGVYMTAGFLRLDAVLQFGSAGCAPVHCQGVIPQFKRTGSALGMQAPSDDNWPAATGAAILVERYTTGNPLPEDVRDGTLYGPGDTSEGTLAVPPPASVASGVPTDDTVGTAALSLADLAAVTGAQIAAAS